MDASHVDVTVLLEQRRAVTAPAVCLLPAGTRRSLHAGPDVPVLVTAHTACPPLMPAGR